MGSTELMGAVVVPEPVTLSVPLCTVVHEDAAAQALLELSPVSENAARDVVPSMLMRVIESATDTDSPITRDDLRRLIGIHPSS